LSLHFFDLLFRLTGWYINFNIGSRFVVLKQPHHYSKSHITTKLTQLKDSNIITNQSCLQNKNKQTVTQENRLNRQNREIKIKMWELIFQRKWQSLASHLLPTKLSHFRFFVACLSISIYLGGLFSFSFLSISLLFAWPTWLWAGVFVEWWQLFFVQRK